MSRDTLQLLVAIHAQLVRIADAACTSNPVVRPYQAYTRTQAARLLRVSTWTIDKARREGLLLEARRIGQRDVRVTGESLVAFMKQREATTVIVRKM